jgi:asparagine synthase (glutamine-hydrolysing)
VIALNGEIYNHLDLRKTLVQKVNWRGHSDTETLLAAIEAWGVEAALKQCVGMFALALWDRQTRSLTLARDRAGEKPLYYGWQGSRNQRAFLFGSELTALKAHPCFAAAVDRGALCLLLRHNYVPAPYSIFQDIRKLEPGNLLTVSLAQPSPKLSKYWDALAVARSGAAAPFSGTDDEAVEALEAVAKTAVRQQMIADVPVGAFLSGGIDSSTVVALMQQQSSRPVKTFTIGFREKGYDEAGHARAVAQHLGTDHTELYVTPREAMAVIPSLAETYSEPFADATQIPNVLLSRLARQQVTVALSGDAGDELFCGYDRYPLTLERWNTLSRFPPGLRGLAGRGISRSLPTMRRRAQMLASRTVDELYLGVVSHFTHPSACVIGAEEPATWLSGRPSDLQGLNAMERMMALDTISYLPDDILVKVDRAAMAVSLETRVPFLDHRLMEFALKLPFDLKLRQGRTKWALRQILYRHVPRELVDRPKQGFSVPLCKWLRGPLQDWAESLLDTSRLQREGFFHPAPVRHLWSEHLNGKHDGSARLWNVLMFQAWLNVQHA